MLQRRVTDTTLVLTADVATTGTLDLREAAAALLHLTGAVTLTFYACPTQGGTYRQVYDSTIAAVSRVATGAMALALPPECFAAAFVRVVLNTGTQTVPVSLKS